MRISDWSSDVCSSDLAIIAITCVVSFMAFKNSRLMNDLILWPPAIARQREYHRLVTYGVVHADFGHLLLNMFTLFFFGRVMEGFFTNQLGTLGYALFYIGARVFSILPPRSDARRVGQECVRTCRYR